MSHAGSLPKGWRNAKLADIATLKTGPFGSSLHQADYIVDGIPVINPMHIIDGKLSPSPTTTISPKKAERLIEFSLRPGDVVIGRRGEMGRCAVVRPQAAGWMCGTGSLIIRSIDSGLSADYLQRFLSHDRIVSHLSSAAVGSTMANLNQRLLLDVNVPLPPPAEQTRIVAKIEELLSVLDAGVTELKAAQKKLRQYRQSLLKVAVEGALTASWRDAQRQRGITTDTGAQLLQRILTERRAGWEGRQLAKFKEQGKAPPKDWQKKYPEPAQPETSDLPELPEEWVWASVDQAGYVQLGRQRAPQFHSGSNMVPYLRVANVFEDHIDISDVMEMHFSVEDEAAFKLDHNDILLNEGQSLELVGRPALYRNELPKACFTNTLVRFRAHASVMPEYALALFRHYMHSGRFRRIAKITTNIAHLGAARFAELEFPVPQYAEQVEIVRRLSEGLCQIESQEMAIKTALKQAAAQRENILRAAFSGQLVPQDPNDEPASVLLERIRSERAARTRRERRAREPA